MRINLIFENAILIFFLFYYFVCILAIFLFIKIFIWKELVGYLVSLPKLSLSKTPRLLAYVISLKIFIRILIVAVLLKKSKKSKKFIFSLKFTVYRFLYIEFKNVWAATLSYIYILSWRTNLRVEVSRNIRSVSYESNIFNVASRAAQTAATRMDTTGYVKKLCLLCETL